MIYEKMTKEQYFKMEMGIPERNLEHFTEDRLKYLLENGKKIYVILEDGIEIDIKEYKGLTWS